MSSDRGVVLVGYGPTTRTALDGLADRFRVVALVRTEPDDTADHARRLGVRVETDGSIATLRALVAQLEPDAVVVSSYDRILPAHLVTACPFVNVHYAPLPRYRGRATVNWAILNGEVEAAITVHRLVPGLDAGGILFQEAVSIGADTTVTELYARLNAIQQIALPEALERALGGDEGRAQDEAQASYACARVPEDGEIDWSAPTVDVYRMVRALTEPFPGACTWLGLDRLWIVAAAPVVDPPRWDGRVPGRVVRVDRRAGWVDVLTGDGVLRVREVRSDEGRLERAADMIRSVRMTLGLRAVDLAARLRELDQGFGTGTP